MGFGRLGDARQETLPPEQLEIQSLEPQDSEAIAWTTLSASITILMDLDIEGST